MTTRFPLPDQFSRGKKPAVSPWQVLLLGGFEEPTEGHLGSVRFSVRIAATSIPRGWTLRYSSSLKPRVSLGFGPGSTLRYGVRRRRAHLCVSPHLQNRFGFFLETGSLNLDRRSPVLLLPRTSHCAGLSAMLTTVSSNGPPAFASIFGLGGELPGSPCLFLCRAPG